jgi:hypothetical protein
MRIASRIDSLAVWFLHKTIFRVWDTGGLLTGSILWHFDYYYFKKIVAVADLQYILFFCNVVIFWTSCSSLPHFWIFWRLFDVVVAGVMGYLNKMGKKAEALSATIWTHLKVGNSVTDSAWGRLSHGTRLLTEGGFKGVYKQTFSGFAPNEQLRKTYACYLSTSTGPVGGTLYITNQKFAFCSDRPLPYAPISGQQAWSYYKVILPLEKVREVLPAHNQNKPSEKYIQVVTIDGHEFWFMGLVNYDKGLKNMQEAVAVTRRGQPVSPAAAQGSGVKQQIQNASYPPINQGDSSSTARNNAPPQQGESRYGNQYAWK